MPFRWPDVWQDSQLAKEVAANRPSTPAEWEKVGQSLSILFSKEGNSAEVSGRGCREHLDRLLAKYEAEDKKSLRRSGSEEQYTELMQLLHDISTYRRDMEEKKIQEKKSKQQKKIEDKEKALEMRAAALSGMSKKKRVIDESDESTTEEEEDDDADLTTTDINGNKGKKIKPKKRASKLSAIELLANKYQQKAEYKEKELNLRRRELELQQKRFEAEADERKAKLQLELDERRAVLAILKDRL